MAKSLRSKWRRKCRAVKRERYGEKELVRLKKTLGIDENAPTDVEMPEITEIATVTDAKTIRELSAIKSTANIKEKRRERIRVKRDKKPVDDECEPMDQDVKRIYDKKTMRDQFGNYPPWMHRRKVTMHKKGRARSQKPTNKQTKRLTRKQKKKLTAEGKL